MIIEKINKNEYLWFMGKYYRHFKGNIYKLIGIAKDSETLEEMVVYQAMYGEGQLWVRPKEMFYGEVERDGKRIPRFQEIGKDEIHYFYLSLQDELTIEMH